jgi:hypothetical protein
VLALGYVFLELREGEPGNKSDYNGDAAAGQVDGREVQLQQLPGQEDECVRRNGGERPGGYDAAKLAWCVGLWQPLQRQRLVDRLKIVEAYRHDEGGDEEAGGRGEKARDRRAKPAQGE